MSLSLKRKESLREGLQRISEKRLKDVLQVIGQEGLTANPVHEVRKAIKSLRATLRLTRGALSLEARRARNEALRDLASRFSGPRDAAVTLSAFEKAYRESLNGNCRPEVRPHWAAQLQQSLAGQANALIPAESYQNAAEGVRHLRGQLLSFEDYRSRGDASQPRVKDDWEKTVEEGLRKTYSQGRRLLRRVAAIPEPPDEQWHELRKRAKDLGYQLALFKKVKGIKPLLAKLDKVGSALGDARDLSLLRDYLGKVRDERELTPSGQRSYERLLTHVNQQRQGLHRRALKAARHVYRRGGKQFTGRMAKRWRLWQGG